VNRFGVEKALQCLLTVRDFVVTFSLLNAVRARGRADVIFDNLTVRSHCNGPDNDCSDTNLDYQSRLDSLKRGERRGSEWNKVFESVAVSHQYDDAERKT